MRLTNKNTAMVIADQYIHLNSRVTGNYRWNNSHNFSHGADSWLKDPGETWDQRNERSNEIFDQFLYRLQPNPNSTFRMYLTRSRPYNRGNISEEIQTKEIDVSSIAAKFKSNVHIYLYSKTSHPKFWREKIQTISTSSDYQEALQELEYLIVFTKHAKANLNFEDSTYSYFSKQFFEKLDETDPILDLDENPIESFSDAKYSNLFEFTSPVTDGRNYQEKISYHISNKYLSTLTFLKDSDTIDRETLPIIKFHSILRGSKESAGVLQKYDSEAFKTGYGLIPYKSSSNMFVYNSEQSDFQNLTCYGFLTYMDPRLIKKYKKAKQTLHQFFENCSHFNGEYFYDKEKYEECKKNLFRGHDKYTDSIIKSFNMPKITSEVMYRDEASTHIDNINISSIASLNNNKTYKTYKEIKSTVDDINSKIQDLQQKVNDHDHSKSRANRFIIDKQNEIERYQRYIANMREEIKKQNEYIQNSDIELVKNNAKLKDYQTLHENLLPQKNKIYLDFFESLDSIDIDSKSEDKLIETFKKQGLYLLEINYVDKNDNSKIIKASEDSSIIPRVKKKSMVDANDFELYSIKFKLVKPVVVRVDPVEKGENCPKIAVGPLVVTVIKNGITLSPLSSNCIFGRSGNTIWLHPHTSSVSLPQTYDQFMQRVMNISVNGCLGEASQAIYTAFKAQDPRQAIMAAMTWVTSANSSDAWGRNWKHFPKISQIRNLDKDIFEDVALSIEEILTDPDEILSNIFEDFHSDEEETFELPQPQITEVQPQETINQQIIEEVPVEEIQQPQEEAQSLRSAGVQGYVPLYSNT